MSNRPMSLTIEEKELAVEYHFVCTDTKQKIASVWFPENPKTFSGFVKNWLVGRPGYYIDMDFENGATLNIIEKGNFMGLRYDVTYNSRQLGAFSYGLFFSRMKIRNVQKKIVCRLKPIDYQNFCFYIGNREIAYLIDTGDKQNKSDKNKKTARYTSDFVLKFQDNTCSDDTYMLIMSLAIRLYINSIVAQRSLTTIWFR